VRRDKGTGGSLTGNLPMMSSMLGNSIKMKREKYCLNPR
jgi:hypothetical protein